MSTLSVIPFSHFNRSSRVPSIFASLFDDTSVFDTNPAFSGPSVNINKEENDYHIDLAIPGYDYDDVSGWENRRKRKRYDERYISTYI